MEKRKAGEARVREEQEGQVPPKNQEDIYEKGEEREAAAEGKGSSCQDPSGQPGEEFQSSDTVAETSEENGKGEGKTADYESQSEEVEDLLAQLETLKREKDEVTTLLQRVKADFDNFRRRTRAEKEEAGFDAVCGFVSKLLPVMDNIERALESANREEVASSFVEGLEMIKKQMEQILEQEGVTTIEAEGETFDPTVHEAVMSTEEGDFPSNTVVEVFQKGYLMKGRVLRPAMVKVKMEGEESPQETATPEGKETEEDPAEEEQE